LRNARVSEYEIARRIADAPACWRSRPSRQEAGADVGRTAPAVAIGRAIVKNPKLFLLDEPAAPTWTRRFATAPGRARPARQRVDAGVIMVTHDQAEAMTLRDRIVVMNDRRIQQVGSPMEVYARPANLFVARFVGSPAMSLLPATLAGEAGSHARVRLGDGSEVATRVPTAGLSRDLRIGVRPEAVSVVAPGNGAVDAAVELVERLGDRTLIYARLSDGAEVTAQAEGTSAARIGDRVGLAIDGAGAHLFDAEGMGHHAQAAA
jgi:multiple sugar transport system ATP-binding protein